jgi:ATP-dependent DNA helicase RecG
LPIANFLPESLNNQFLSILKESQKTEFKENWRDEYLKHICAFANTHGGSLFIGISDDGAVAGIKDSKKLLEDIPNKAINYLGIVIDVHLHEDSGKEYLEIIVAQSSVPIAFKGVYYVKSGSTRQELKGAELQHFILKKIGQTFDELPAETAGLKDIDEKVIRKFLRKAIIANRISPEAESDDLPNLISNLKLSTEEGKLKNAAILLFGKDPLRFISSVSFRIGRFGDSDHDLKFQDVIEGNIFEMPDRVIETLRAKYLISPIRYEGLQRIEELEYPEEALREAILNAVIHKDYTGVHIQMSVYDDMLMLWNDGKLPVGMHASMLKVKHPSKPRNIDIAGVFFKAGYIEAWGRGIAKIIDGCKKAGLPEPLIEEFAGGVQVTFFKQDQFSKHTTSKSTSKTTSETTRKTTRKQSEKILELLHQTPVITAAEIAYLIGISEEGVRYHLKTLKGQKIIKRIGSPKGGHWEVTGKP